MKSHVSMEQHGCVVCGMPYDTGAILLDRRLRASLDTKTVTGWGMCPEHEKLRQEGFIAVVACDEKKSGGAPGAVLKPQDAYRTGGIAHIKRAAFAKVFNVPAPSGGVVFAEDNVVKILEGMARDAAGQDRQDTVQGLEEKPS